MKLFIYLVCLSLLLPTMVYAENKSQHAEHKITSGVEALSSDLRDLLSREMRALESGMMSIIPAFHAGEWDKIAATAGKMKNSYVLKQKLSESQARELHTLLPPSFIEKDRQFHYLAGMLEHAAKNRKAELINFYFSEMNRSCPACHTLFATHKFPALLPAKADEQHSQH